VSKIVISLPDENRDLARVSTGCTTCPARFIGRNIWFVRFGMVIAFMSAWINKVMIENVQCGLITLFGPEMDCVP